MSFLTGKPQKQTSESGNTAYPWIQQNYGSGGASAFNGGMGAIQSILGLGGSGGAGALDNWWNSSGGNFLLDQGVDSINSNFYSRGLGQSGAAMKALEGYRSGLASTKLNEVMQNYFGFANLGLDAGKLVGGAGSYSKGSGSGGTQGLGSLIGAALAFI